MECFSVVQEAKVITALARVLQRLRWRRADQMCKTLNPKS